MGLNFVGKKAAPAKTEPPAKNNVLKFGSKKPAEKVEEAPPPPAKKTFGSSSAKTTASPPKGTTSTPPKKDTPVNKLNFLNTGKKAQDAIVAEEAKAAARAAEAGKMFRFWMKPGEDRSITFLDGDLGEDGLIECANYYDHQVKVNGEWRNFVCTADADTSQPCPICEKGDSKPQLVVLFTVIDHTPHTIQNGEKAGQVIQNTRKLFVCKMKTLKLLNKIASKKGGLTGWTFDVSRTGDKEPNVGNNFTPDKHWDDMEAFAGEYELTEEQVQPADYNDEITALTPEELIKMGVGKSFSGVGTKKVDKDKLKGAM